MPRRLRPIPLAAWIASRDPVLRARAETALYHCGPDAGDALFAAADYLSRFTAIKREMTLQPALILLTALVFWFFQGDRSPYLRFCLGALALQALVRMAWIIGTDLYWRRARLKILGLALAKRNDLRSIGPLLEAWRPLSLSGRRLRDDEIEAELTRVLPSFLAQKSIDLRTYKKRILRRKVGRLFPSRFWGRGVACRGGFTDTRSDLIVTLIQLMSRSTSEADLAMILRIARMDASDTNAIFVRDAALAYQDTLPGIIGRSSIADPIVVLPSNPAHQIPAVAKRS